MLAAATTAIGDVHLLDEFLLLQGTRHVVLVPQDQNRNVCQGWLAEQLVQLVTRLFEGFRISGVDNIPVCKSKDRSQKDVPLRASCKPLEHGSRHEHELEIVGVSVHDRTDAAAISLPHSSEARLPSKVPELDRHITFVDLPHVESDGGDGFFVEFTDLSRN